MRNQSQVSDIQCQQYLHRSESLFLVGFVRTLHDPVSDLMMFVCLLHAAMTLSGKAYFDAVSKVGENAIVSPVSRELGEFQASRGYIQHLQ